MFKNRGAYAVTGSALLNAACFQPTPLVAPLVLKGVVSEARDECGADSFNLDFDGRPPPFGASNVPGTTFVSGNGEHAVFQAQPLERGLKYDVV